MEKIITLPLVLGITGCIALLIGLFGGGVKAKEIEVQKISILPRIFSSFIGLALIGMSTWLSFINPSQASETPSSTPTEMQKISASPTASIVLSTPLPPTSIPPTTVVVSPTSLPSTPIPPTLVPPTNTPSPTLVPSPTQTPIPPLPYEEYVDTGTQEQGMHACPIGFVIAGVHIDKNLFLCRRVVRNDEEKYVATLFDAGPGTQRANMHACPSGTYMRGLRADQNNLLCSYDSRRVPPQEWLTEFEDYSSQGYNMHICPATPNSISFLTGIRADQNRFLCGIYNP